MAIDLLTFRKLLELAPRLPRGSRALVMGRQNFLLPNAIGRMARQKPVYQTMLNQYGHDIDLERIVDVDGYCDTLFDFLGFAETDYMDVSDYEGANVLHDLNHPVPPALHGQYDFILDGGTSEHVFDIAEAFRNYHRMLRKGGQLLAFNPANNWLGHGFYQIGPELVWSFWRDALGYRVHECSINAMRDWYASGALNVEPPETRDRRRNVELAKPRGVGIQLLIYRVEKSQDKPDIAAAQQSDYVADWDRNVSKMS